MKNFILLSSLVFSQTAAATPTAFKCLLQEYSATKVNKVAGQGMISSNYFRHSDVARLQGIVFHAAVAVSTNGNTHVRISHPASNSVVYDNKFISKLDSASIVDSTIVFSESLSLALNCTK